MGIAFAFSPERARERACTRVRLANWLQEFSHELRGLAGSIPPEDLHWQLAWLRDGVDAAFIEVMFGFVAKTDRDDCPGGRHEG